MHTFDCSSMADDKWIDWRQWREISFDLLHGVEVSSKDEDDFRLTVEHATRGHISGVRVKNTPHLGERTKVSVQRFPTDVIGIVSLTGGRAVFEMGDDQVVVSPGDIYIHDLERPFKSQGIGAEMIEWTVVHVHRSLISDKLDALNAAQALKLDGARPENRILASYLSSFFDNLTELDKPGAEAFEVSTVDMLTNVLLLRGPSDQSKQARDLSRVQAALIAHLRDPNLNLQKIAEEIGIGPRTIHRLFQSTGTTPAKWLEDRRLEAIAKELRNATGGGRLITSIAYAYGYKDPSHLSRNFKKRYGLSPRQYRQG